MSHLRAPAVRPDRREGGRHGRPVARPVPALPETHIRPQLMRLAVLPPVAVALSGCAAVLFTVRSTGARPSLTLLAVLTGSVSVTAAGIVIAAVAAGRAARSVSERVGMLRRNAARGEAELLALVDTLRRGEVPPQRKSRGGPPADADDFELLAADLSRAHDGAVTAVVQAAQLSSQAGSEQKLEVFVNLARRLQSLVHREISILDELENEIEDPDLLKGLFHVDHLATRIRRHAENLAVLGGAVSRRQWSNPVSMTEVLRSAIAEVEQYSRVKLVPPIDGELRGHAVADVIHLLAELVENATVFSAPHTQVLLRANLVTSGLAVEVEDRGLGMPVGEQAGMNDLLADPDQVNVASLLADGRIGLFVVSQLARRHGIDVRLQSNIYGGVQAVLVVPQSLLGSAPGVPGVEGQPREQVAEGAGAVTRAPGGTGIPEDAYGVLATPGGATLDGRHAPQATPVPAGGGRRRHAQPGAAPAPLPVRTQETRHTPAEALPGIRPEDRTAVAEHAGAPPVPRVGAVRGTMGKPQLPRRRAQEHIVPQLRGGPAPRQDNEVPAGHDPGLMAAFQRGIGLAEAQQHLDGPREASPLTGPNGMGVTDMGLGEPRGDSGPGGTRPGTGAGDAASSASHATHADGMHMDFAHTEATHTEATHMQATHTGVMYREATPMGTVHGAAPHQEPAFHEQAFHEQALPGSPDREAGHMDPAYTSQDQSARDRMASDPMVGEHMVGDHLTGDHVAGDHATVDHMAGDRTAVDHMGAGHMAVDHLGVGRMVTDDLAPDHMGPSHTPVLGPIHSSDFTARPDGSAAAG